MDRPVMRYHGGKFRNAEKIMRYFPKHKAYVEPFGGAASILMQKARVALEVYNDLDDEIVNVFKVLRSPVASVRLQEELILTPFAFSEYLKAYSPCTDPVERARRTLTRAAMGVGSNAATREAVNGFRSKRAACSSPARDFANYPPHVEAFCARLQGVTIECRPALDIIQRYDSPDTLFYVDPPYVVSTRTLGHQSYRHEMTDVEHEALATALHEVKGKVILSGYDCDLYQRLYAGWKSVSFKALADKAQERTETIWISDNAITQASLLAAM